MIVDVHRHMWSADQRHPALFNDTMADYRSQSVTFNWETTSQDIVAEMDGAGVDVSVVILADFGFRFGTPVIEVEEENRMISKARDRYPERVIAFYGIDPQRTDSSDRFEQAIKTNHVSGLKLHPTTGYYPHDEICYPLYELCVAYGVPVLFHSGPGFHPLLYGRTAHPLEFDKVAADFPDLTMIMGHAGGDWWYDCVAVAKSHENMYPEFSEWQAIFRDTPEEGIRVLDYMIRNLGSERVMWGSDFPGLRKEMSLKSFVSLCQNFPSLAKKYGFAISSADIDAFLGGNAARILNLA